jgi:hypothetical protein
MVPVAGQNYSISVLTATEIFSYSIEIGESKYSLTLFLEARMVP